MWLDPANAQNSWGNLRAAVAQQNKLRAAQNQDYSSWHEGYSREPRAEEGDKEAADPKGRRGYGQYSQPHQAATDSAQKEWHPTDDGAPQTPHDDTTAATPLEGGTAEHHLKSAQNFPFTWGDRYFVAIITWYADGTRDTNVCTTAGPELPQEEKDYIVEFLNTLQEGAPMTEVLERARNAHLADSNNSST